MKKDYTHDLDRISKATTASDLDALQREFEMRKGAVPKALTDALGAREDEIRAEGSQGVSDDRRESLNRAADIVGRATSAAEAMEMLREEGIDVAPMVTMKLREGKEPLREVGGEPMPELRSDGTFLVDAERAADIDRYWRDVYAIVRVNAGSKKPKTEMPEGQGDAG